MARNGGQEGAFENSKNFQNTFEKASNIFRGQRRKAASCAQIAQSLLESAGMIFGVATRSYEPSVF